MNWTQFALYNRGDVRAELNRVVKSCEPALRALAAAVEELRAIGKTTDFEKDAELARLALMARAARALGASEVAPAGSKAPAAEPPPVERPAKKARSKPGPGRLQIGPPERARVRE